MGVNDAREQLEVAKAEVVRLRALMPECDGGCSYHTGPEETCSLHGRPVAEVWEIVNRIGEERDAAVKSRDAWASRMAEVCAKAVEDARDAIMPPVNWNLTPTGQEMPGTAEIDQFYYEVHCELTAVAYKIREGEPLVPRGGDGAWPTSDSTNGGNG